MLTGVTHLLNRPSLLTDCIWTMLPSCAPVNMIIMINCYISFLTNWLQQSRVCSVFLLHWGKINEIKCDQNPFCSDSWAELWDFRQRLNASVTDTCCSGGAAVEWVESDWWSTDQVSAAFCFHHWNSVMNSDAQREEEEEEERKLPETVEDIKTAKT